MATHNSAHSQIVSRDEWLTAQETLLAREKELIKHRDKTSAERRRLPSEISATTVRAAGILNRLGWEFIKTVQYPDGGVSLYRCKL